MKEIKALGLCIRSVDYKENDKILTIYIEGVGKITTTARGVRKAKAKLKHAATPFNYGEYLLSENRGYYSLIGCDAIAAHYALWGRIEQFYMANIMLELLDKFANVGGVEDELFHTVADFLNEADKGCNLCVFNAYLFEFIRYAGFEMRLQHYTSADILYMDMDNGGISCAAINRNGVKNRRISYDEYISLIKAANNDYTQPKPYETALILLSFIEYNAEITLKSISGLQELFNE